MSFTVTAKLICVFVFAYAKSRFSHGTAHMKAKKIILSVCQGWILDNIGADQIAGVHRLI